MILILLMNGASVVPLFIPMLPQVILVALVLRHARLDRIRIEPPVAAAISRVFLALGTGAALGSDLDNALRFWKLLGNSVVAVFVARALTARYGETLPSAYSHAVLAMSVAGLLGLLLSLLTDWHITAAIGDRVYNTNLLNVWLLDSGFNSSQTTFSPFPYRLQSFFDEPGTYGMLLVPALFHFLDTDRRCKAAVITLCVLLTESASAWLLTALLFVFQATRIKRATDKALLITVIGSVVIGAFPEIVRLYEIKAGIDDAYLNNSSFGTRSLEYDYIFGHWLTHVLPLSSVSSAYAELGTISSSYVTWYIFGGVAFVVLFLSVLGGLCRALWAARREGSTQQRFAFVLGAVLFSSGFQRTAFLDNIMFMSLVYWALGRSRFSAHRIKALPHAGR